MKGLFPIALLVMLAWAGTARAQDPVFSQFYTAGTFLNPATAGQESRPMVGINYRSQWQAADIPFSTFQATYLHPFIKPGSRPKHTGTLGLTVVNDQTGTNSEFNQTGALLTGAYNIHLNDFGNHFISVGFQAGGYDKAINSDAFRWSSQYDPLIGYDASVPGGLAETSRRFYPVINVGMAWRMELKSRYGGSEFMLYQGVAASNLNQPDVSVFEVRDRLPVTYKLHGGMLYNPGGKWAVSPHYLVQYQADRWQVNTGAYFTYILSDIKRNQRTALMAGGWYRLGDAFIFSGGIEYRAVQVVLTYDRNVHALSRYFGNVSAFEVSVQWRLIKTGHYKRYGTPMI